MKYLKKNGGWAEKNRVSGLRLRFCGSWLEVGGGMMFDKLALHAGIYMSLLFTS